MYLTRHPSPSSVSSTRTSTPLSSPSPNLSRVEYDTARYDTAEHDTANYDKTNHDQPGNPFSLFTTLVMVVGIILISTIFVVVVVKIRRSHRIRLPVTNPGSYGSEGVGERYTDTEGLANEVGPPDPTASVDDRGNDSVQTQAELDDEAFMRHLREEAALQEWMREQKIREARVVAPLGPGRYRGCVEGDGEREGSDSSDSSSDDELEHDPELQEV